MKRAAGGGRTGIDGRRVALFLAIAFAIAWAVGLIVALSGGLTDSPMLVPSLRLTLATVLLATGYMWAPALAHIITRLATREGWSDTWLRPYPRGWPSWLAAWFGPAVLTILGMALFFLVLPRYYDPSLSTLRRLLGPRAASTNLWGLVATEVLGAVLVAPVLNGLFTLGEEFGWRAYLLPKLMPLGWRKATVLVGVIWGVWHWPVIAMGYEYGFGYRGFPWVGFLTFLWFTVPGSVLLAWVTRRGKCVWPAVVGHGAINGIAGLAALFVQGQPSPLLGPLPVGLIGGAALMAAGIWVWLRGG